MNPDIVDRNQAFGSTGFVRVECERNPGKLPGFLAGINEQTSSEENVWIKINQFRPEQIDGKAHRLLQSRLA